MHAAVCQRPSALVAVLGRRWRSDECRRRSVSAVRHRIDVGGANLVARRVESALLAPHQPPFHRRSTASASKPAGPGAHQRRSAVTFTRGCSKRYQPCDMARGSMRGSLRPPESLHELTPFPPLPSAFADLHTHGACTRRTRSVALRLSVRSQAHTALSRSECEPAQAAEVDMCASVLVDIPLLFVSGLARAMPRLAV